jgi:MinD-like ATPase involved in chromosome partitioning or flagellar assembly
MHVATFYSYKGGVGRTMALVNTALLLTRRGRRVLIVDFDLEAPGLPTYDVFSSASEHIGLVDYISEYLRTNASPEASAYIKQCEFEGKPIWVMPAGSNVDLGYSRRLNQIDWQNLYDNRDGFLMFEDLRSQWDSFGGFGFDYVLIDSRTGYTDVGGICTRQLPNSVVAMFLPNAQNIRGLSNVVNDIRQVDSTTRPVHIHFCPSNVPNLDDERDILKTNISLARSMLKYRESSSVIHYYDSLDVLKDTPFVVSRPNSRLSREYGELEKAIIAGNFEDRDGAIITLQNILSRHAASRPDDRNDLVMNALPAIYQISNYHHLDPEIAYYLGRTFSLVGFVDDEVEALSVAIEGGHLEAESRVRRARAFQSSGRPSDAIADLVAVIQSRGSEPFNVVTALTTLRSADPQHWLAAAVDIPSMDYADDATIIRVAATLRVSMDGLQLSRTLLERAISRPDSDADGRLKQELALSLIGLREFSEAADILCNSDEGIAESSDISRVFNGAMAIWGRDQIPPLKTFSRVLEIGGGYRGMDNANYHQCMALAAFVVGDTAAAERSLSDAKSALGGPARVYSCWSYTEVSRVRMSEHLKEMKAQADLGEIRPPSVIDDPQAALSLH